MEWTNGYKMVEIKVGDKTYNGFYKVTRKGVITVEAKIDIPVKPYDHIICLLYTSPSPRDGLLSRMPSSA